MALKDPKPFRKHFNELIRGRQQCILRVYPYKLEDEKFLNGIVGYIKQNISNPDLSVERLSSNMNISRAWLYKKVLLLTGKSLLNLYVRSGFKEPSGYLKIHK